MLNEKQISEFLDKQVKANPEVKTLMTMFGIRDDQFIIKYQTRIEKNGSAAIHGGHPVEIILGPQSAKEYLRFVRDVFGKFNKYHTVMAVVPYKLVNTHGKTWVRVRHFASSKQGLFELIPLKELEVLTQKITVLKDPKSGESVSYIGDDPKLAEMQIELSQKIATKNPKLELTKNA